MRCGARRQCTVLDSSSSSSTSGDSPLCDYKVSAPAPSLIVASAAAVSQSTPVNAECDLPPSEPNSDSSDVDNADPAAASVAVAKKIAPLTDLSNFWERCAAYEKGPLHYNQSLLSLHVNRHGLRLAPHNVLVMMT